MRRLPTLTLLTAIAAASPVFSQIDDPAPAAYQALRAASAVPVTGSTSVGALRFLAFDVPAVGTSPIGQARSFLAAYGAALGLTGSSQQLAVRTGGDPGPIQIVSFAETYRGVPIFSGEIRVGLKTDGATGGARVVMAG